jgi:DNA polymerase III delta subunit
MKVVIIHGEDIDSSRARFLKIIEGARKKGFEIISLSGQENEASQLTTLGLFSLKQLYLIEDIKKVDLSVLERDLGGNVMIWHKGIFPKNLAKKLPQNTKYEKFDLPKIIYNFLDSLTPGNSRNSLKLLRDLQKNNANEFIIALMNSHLRDVWLVLEDSNILGYPQWRVGKLSRQGRALGKDKVERILRKIVKADMRAKTGELELAESLDLIIGGELK